MKQRHLAPHVTSATHDLPCRVRALVRAPTSVCRLPTLYGTIKSTRPIRVIIKRKAVTQESVARWCCRLSSCRASAGSKSVNEPVDTLFRLLIFSRPMSYRFDEHFTASWTQPPAAALAPPLESPEWLIEGWPRRVTYNTCRTVQDEGGGRSAARDVMTPGGCGHGGRPLANDFISTG